MLKASFRTVTTLLTALAAVGGCRELNLKDGSLRCSKASHCPSPLVCRNDHYCWRTVDPTAANPDAEPDARGMDAGSIEVAIPEDRGSVEAEAPVDSGSDSEPGSSADARSTDIADDSNADGTSAADLSLAERFDVPAESNADAASDSNLSLAERPDVETPPRDADTESIGVLPQASLTVLIAGPPGSGKVISSTTGVGIDCGATCTAVLEPGIVVRLLPSPSANGVFTSWSGCSRLTGTTCDVTVSKDVVVTATFKNRNGVGCGDAPDCASGFCVDGTCCDSLCSGNCNASCQTGTCQHKAWRTACGSIPGPAGDGSEIARICDGAGNCTIPVIKCATVSGRAACDLKSSTCCYVGDARDMSCSVGPTCTFQGQSCAATGDCPKDTFCCAHSLPGGLTWAVCATTCTDVQYCDPNAPEPGCLKGTCQTFWMCQ
jgi:hypothetical protein